MIINNMTLFLFSHVYVARLVRFRVCIWNEDRRESYVIEYIQEYILERIDLTDRSNRSYRSIDLSILHSFVRSSMHHHLRRRRRLLTCIYCCHYYYYYYADTQSRCIIEPSQCDKCEDARVGGVGGVGELGGCGAVVQILTRNYIFFYNFILILFFLRTFHANTSLPLFSPSPLSTSSISLHLHHPFILSTRPMHNPSNLFVRSLDVLKCNAFVGPEIGDPTREIFEAS